MDPLSAIQIAMQLLSLATTLVPQIEADVAQWKQLDGATDQAALDAQITQLHQDTLALTAKLDALKTKIATP